MKRNQKGPIYWATCVITVCEPNRVLEFTVGSSVDKGLNNWRYELQPSGTGTDVTESFRLKDILPLACTGRCSAGPAGRRTAKGCAPPWSA